jgi:hypothetical protein
MIKLILPLLISPIIQARVADIDFIDGKVTQIVDVGNGECGQEGFVVVETKHGFRMIYEYRHFNPPYYQQYVGSKVRIYYQESLGRTLDCEAGILNIRRIK